jgi:ATP-dependent RNA helicase DDX3X
MIPGRTARIGNEGLATSFYNSRDDDLGPDLVKLLIENHQTVPDFLEQHQPSDTNLSFEDDTTDGEAEKGREWEDSETGAWAANSDDDGANADADNKEEEANEAWGEDAEGPADLAEDEPAAEEQTEQEPAEEEPARGSEPVDRDLVFW